MTAPLANLQSDWSAIRQFRDFWDVPRMLIIDWDGESVLLDCPFDEEREDFADEYKVYSMPSLSDAELDGSWADFPQRAIKLLGKIPVSKVQFDETSRSYLNRRSLDDILRRPVDRNMAMSND